VLTISPDPAYTIGAGATQQLWLTDDEAAPAAPSAVAFATTALQIGRTGAATLIGGQPAGLAALWFALRPAWGPVPPLGTLQLDLGLGGLFVAGAFDANGTAVLPVTMPLLPSLAGIECWWQCVAQVPASPFFVLTDAASLAIVGSPAF
jgi:hypothetical protein